MKTKITAFIFDLSQGGAQGVFVTVMNHYADLGYEVNIVVQNLINDVHSSKLRKSIDVYNLNCSSAKKSFVSIIKYIKNHDIELAWVFGPELSVNVFLAKKILNRRFKIYSRSINTLSEEFKRTDSLFRKYVTNTFLKIFYPKMDIIVAQSNYMKTDLTKSYRVDPNRVVVINNALSDKFEKKLQDIRCYPKKNYILYAGRLEKQKGLYFLLEAFSYINNKEIWLYMIGDGSQKKELMGECERLGIADRVKFISYTNNIEEYYSSAKLTVLTSYFEGFPNVLIESIACGTPVVSFDLPSGPSEIITEKNGILVDYLNVNKLARAIELALRQRWCESDVKKTAERFSQKDILSRYEELLK